MRILLLVLTTTLLGMATPCKAQDKSPEVELVHQPCIGKTVARVYVSADGVVSINGAVTPTESLLKALQNLRPPVQSVCYSRANPQAYEPHPAALKALDAIVQLKLPVAFYWDAEFQKRVHFKQ